MYPTLSFGQLKMCKNSHFYFGASFRVQYFSQIMPQSSQIALRHSQHCSKTGGNKRELKVIIIKEQCMSRFSKKSLATRKIVLFAVFNLLPF